MWTNRRNRKKRKLNTHTRASWSAKENCDAKNMCCCFDTKGNRKKILFKMVKFECCFRFPFNNNGQCDDSFKKALMDINRHIWFDFEPISYRSYGWKPPRYRIERKNTRWSPTNTHDSRKMTKRTRRKMKKRRLRED